MTAQEAWDAVVREKLTVKTCDSGPASMERPVYGVLRGEIYVGVDDNPIRAVEKAVDYINECRKMLMEIKQ